MARGKATAALFPCRSGRLSWGVRRPGSCAAMTKDECNAAGGRVSTTGYTVDEGEGQ